MPSPAHVDRPDSHLHVVATKQHPSATISIRRSYVNLVALLLLAFLRLSPLILLAARGGATCVQCKEFPRLILHISLGISLCPNRAWFVYPKLSIGFKLYH